MLGILKNACWSIYYDMLGILKVNCWSIYFCTFLLGISKANCWSIYYEILGMYFRQAEAYILAGRRS